MLYKLNMFLREWNGYDKVYNYLKEKLFFVLLIRTLAYVLAILVLYFTSDSLQTILRLIIYVPTTILEYFLGAIYYEQNEKAISFSSYILIFFNIIVIFKCSTQLIFMN